MPQTAQTLLDFDERGHASRTSYVGGYRGNLDALARMRRGIRRDLGLDGGKFCTELFELASSILRAFDVPAHDPLAALAAIHIYVTSNVRYVQDPTGAGEQLQHPLYTLKRGYGDCDDLIRLELTLCGMVGLDALTLEAAVYSEAAQSLEHVYGSVDVDEQTVYIDPTADTEPLGYRAEPLGYVRLNVLDDVADMEVGGLLDSILGIGKVVAGIFGNRGGGQPNTAETQAAGKQFDAAAAEVTRIMHGIAAKGEAITPADYATAANAYSALASIAAQLGNVEYVAAQWASEDYRPAYESLLSQIKAVADRNAATTGGGTTANTDAPAGSFSSALSGSLFGIPLSYILLGAGAFALARR